MFSRFALSIGRFDEISLNKVSNNAYKHPQNSCKSFSINFINLVNNFAYLNIGGSGRFGEISRFGIALSIVKNYYGAPPPPEFALSIGRFDEISLNKVMFVIVTQKTFAFVYMFDVVVFVFGG